MSHFSRDRGTNDFLDWFIGNLSEQLFLINKILPFLSQIR